MKNSNIILFLLLVLLQPIGAVQKEYIQNPILPGFNPDPCIVRAGTDYYIVTSTFEWFPGLPVYHSKDLVNWEQIGHVLTRKSQLDLTGIADADGVYAPSITYHDGLFYVTYTIVQGGITWPLKGYPNYIVTAKDPRGPWSEPVYINSLGFDPTLFIDDDGKAYVLVRIFDHRKGQPSSPGIGMHEVDLKTLKPVGEPKFIYSGWGQRSAEGPKMLKKDGFYYLFTAEGGTGYGHYEAVARSKNIEGPYERAPKKFYTSANDSNAVIQKAGHGTLVSTPAGEWYTTHLGSRPLVPNGNCPLGRETFLQKVVWNADGWPELSGGSEVPSVEVEAPALPVFPVKKKQTRDDFNSSVLDVRYQSLREPVESDWLRLDRKKGFLSMRGRRALGGFYGQSLLAQRITSCHQQIETCVEFTPTNYRHAAGLSCFYNTKHFYSLGLTFDEKEGFVLELTGADKNYMELTEKRVPLYTNVGKVYMRMTLDGYSLQYYYSLDGKEWLKIGAVLDFGKISDEYAEGYTGAMAALFVQDLMYEDRWADFDYFEVRFQEYSR